MDVNELTSGHDIEKYISKEAYNFRVKRNVEPEYVIMDENTYQKLRAYCLPLDRTLEVQGKEVDLREVFMYSRMRIVRTFLAGYGIAVGRSARP